MYYDQWRVQLETNITTKHQTQPEIMKIIAYFKEKYQLYFIIQDVSPRIRILSMTYYKKFISKKKKKM